MVLAGQMTGWAKMQEYIFIKSRVYVLIINKMQSVRLSLFIYIADVLECKVLNPGGQD